MVLITGGSSGIGFELARSFSRRSFDIIINGRDESRLIAAKQKLEEEFGRKVEIFPQDIGVPGGAKKLYDKISTAGHDVDILVNNAGIGLLAPTEEIAPKDDARLLQLNVSTVVELCKLYLPHMYEKGKGRILNIASIAAYQPGPYNATYFASKAFVLSYSRAIRFEAKRHGVRICTLCPGSTKTNFFEREGMETPIISGDPAIVAEYACKKLFKNKEIIIPGLMNRISRLIPVGLRIKLVVKMQEFKK